MMKFTNAEVEDIRANYPKGTIVKLKNMSGENIPEGSIGTVKSVDDMGHIHVNWENGSSLALIPETDDFVKCISCLKVEPGKIPQKVIVEESLSAWQEGVGGYIECVYPFEDEVVLICNEEGKLDHLPLNRAIFKEPELEELTYQEMKKRFSQCESTRKQGERPMLGYIVFTEDSYDTHYTETSRTYIVSSDNKAFQSNAGGYSIYGTSKDLKDANVRLEAYMRDERGGKDGWKVEKCFIVKDDSHQILDVIAGNFFICSAPSDSDSFHSLNEDQMEKYAALFHTPEKFSVDQNGTIHVIR